MGQKYKIDLVSKFDDYLGQDFLFLFLRNLRSYIWNLSMYIF